MNLKHKIKDSIEYSVHKKYIQSVQKCIQSVYEAYTKCVQSLHRVYTKCTKCKGQFHAGESLPGQSIPATAQSPLLPSVCLFVCLFVCLLHCLLHCLFCMISRVITWCNMQHMQFIQLILFVQYTQLIHHM